MVIGSSNSSNKAAENIRLRSPLNVQQQHQPLPPTSVVTATTPNNRICNASDNDVTLDEEDDFVVDNGRVNAQYVNNNSGMTGGSYKTAERQLLRKLDWRIIPWIFILYFLSVLDRSNVGYAMTMNKAEHHTMMDTAGISPQQNNIGLGLFYVAYIIFEIPSNLMMAHVNPSYWIARIMITWSVVTGCMAAIARPWHFYLLRFLLGLFEAGLWPGITFYTTLWYKEDEISTRIGVTYLAAPTSGAVGGLISAAVQLIDTRGNLYGWQWLFVIFGILTFIFGVATIWVLPSTPEDSTKFLNERERYLIRKRMKEHTDPFAGTSPSTPTIVSGSIRGGRGNGFNAETAPTITSTFTNQQEIATENTHKITVKRVLREFKDLKNWFFVILYFMPVMAATSLGYFLPKIVEQMGEFDSIHVSLMSIPPYAFGMVMVYIVNKLSDRYQSRGWYIVGGCIVSFIGFCILSFAGPVGARYFGLMIIAGGTYPTVPLSMAWTANSKEDAVSVATATGIVSSVANFGALICTFALYSGWPADGPRYVGSNMLNGGAMLFAAVCAFVLRLHLSRLNKKMIKRKQDSGSYTDIPLNNGEKTYPYIL